MSVEQTTDTVPSSDYTPLAMRSDIGDAVEDRRPEQVRADRTYQAVMPQEPEHEFDGRIQSLEAQVRQKKKDREFGQLETLEERALYTLKERRASDEREADHKAAVAEWQNEVKPQVDRLKELRAEFTTAAFKGSDVAEIDRAIIQFSTLGSDLRIGQKMLEAVEDKFQASLDQQEFSTEAEIAGLRNRIAQLKAKRIKAVEPEPDIDDPILVEFKQHQLEVKAAEAAGDREEAKRLTSVYWAKRVREGY